MPTDPASVASPLWVQSWVFDLADRPVTEIPLRAVGAPAPAPAFEYDPERGWLVSRVEWADAALTSVARREDREYFHDGRLRRQTHSGSGVAAYTAEFGFGYTAAGQLEKTATDGTGTWRWTYDRVGNITQAASPSGSLGFSWTTVGKPREVQFPDGAKYRYLWWDDGSLRRTEVWADGLWVTLMGYTYGADGNLDLERYEGTSVWRNWDWSTRTPRVARWWESLVDGVENHDVTLGWTDAGRLASVVDSTNSPTPVSTTAYTYDPAGQLVAVDRTGGPPDHCGTYTYTYGRRGERVGQSRCGVDTTYQWDSHGRLATATSTDDPASAEPDARAVTFTSDAQGRRTGRTVVRDPGPGQVSERTDTYRYDARGKLAGIDTTYEQGNTRREMRTWSPDGDLDHVAIARNNTPVWDLDLDWDPTGPVRQIAMGRNTSTPGAPWTRAGYGIRRISLADDPGYQTADYYSYDHAGSATAGPGATAVAPPHGYEPFGQPLDWAAEFHFGYRGELHLDQLLHLRARDYDPATGTFLTPDPLDGVDGTPTVANGYHYADNDPVNKQDPLGLRPSDDTTFVDPPPAPPCPEGQQPWSTPGNPSIHVSANEVCSPPWETDRFVDFVNWLAGWNKELAISTFHANLKLRTTSPMNEDLAFVQGLAAIKGGADLRICAPTGTAVGGGFGSVNAHVMCLWNVPRAAVGAFIVNDDALAYTQGHYVFCKTRDNCGSPDDIRDPNQLAHELVHVRQWETYGDAFAGMYLGAEATGNSGPCGNPYEREAYAVAPEYPPNSSNPSWHKRDCP